MLLNFIKVDFREDLLLKKYFELINSGVKPSEILVLMQNSTLKKQFSNKKNDVRNRTSFFIIIT